VFCRAGNGKKTFRSKPQEMPPLTMMDFLLSPEGERIREVWKTLEGAPIMSYDHENKRKERNE